jgi:cell division protein FtsB
MRRWPFVDKNYIELQNIINGALQPLVSKLNALEEKVDKLTSSYVARDDLEKLRQETVLRDGYEVRLASLVARDTQLEEIIKRLDTHMRQEIKDLEERIDKQAQAELSSTDRGWIRFSQLIGAIAIIISLLGVFIGHVQFH